MTDQNNEMHATAREWRIALFVVIGGFVIAIAIAAWILLKPVSAPQVVAPQSMTPDQRREWLVTTGQVFCQRELLNAMGIGILPPYAKANGLPQSTAQPGRFTCVASTGVAKYTIAADAVCATLPDPRCVSIYSVTSDDGTVLFKRPNPKPVK